jgi:hypothetical protein
MTDKQTPRGFDRFYPHINADGDLGRRGRFPESDHFARQD